MSEITDSSAPSPNDDFVQLLAQCQLKLQLYIVALVGNVVDAEDIRQNTNTVLWQKRDEYQPGTNYLAWAFAIARLEVLKHRDRRPRDLPGLSPEVMALLGEESVQKSKLFEQRREALAGCVHKLGASDRNLVQSYYQGGTTLAALAEGLKRSASSVRHSISRIRRRLRACIESTLAHEGQG